MAWVIGVYFGLVVTVQDQCSVPHQNPVRTIGLDDHRGSCTAAGETLSLSFSEELLVSQEVNPMAIVRWFKYSVGLLLLAVLLFLVYDAAVDRGAGLSANPVSDRSNMTPEPTAGGGPIPHQGKTLNYAPRSRVDESGYQALMRIVRPWPQGASIAEIGSRFQDATKQTLQEIDRYLASPELSADARGGVEFIRASLLNFEGDADEAYVALSVCRKVTEGIPALAETNLFTIIYFQGVTALRKGENDNCIMCRGESSCILPISPEAVHANQAGSRLAIRHFMEYLEVFPEDLGVAWLLNIAHATLGEHPSGVDPRFLIPLEHYNNDSEHSIGKFRDIGHVVGVNRFNQAGGGIMEDFDNDGLLDIVVSSFDPTAMMGFYRNKGSGTFEDISQSAGLEGQLGGLYCVQTDYNNDGNMDVFVVRGAWFTSDRAMPPSLLRNNGDRTFTDVTLEAGLGKPINSISAQWADYDNDGWLDVFVCCESQPNRLYRNRQDGTFEEVARFAGVSGSEMFCCKGATWLDFDNDGFQDLFVNNFSPEGAQLYRNERDGKFSNVTQEMGIDGPRFGFSCWSWDFDNDGWLDIFATSYDRTLGDVVLGLVGKPNSASPNRLFRNLEGKGFEDVTAKMGLADCYATMGSNFGDLDNDGFLDMYLGTGDPAFSTLVPNRLIRNINGERFIEITSSSGTGNLQKGHSVACGDWDRDGNVDIFIQMGGAVNGDKYHNILFQNPGHDNAWCSIKLIGEQSNRAAIGARIKIVTSGDNAATIYRTVSSGSSFGANPLQQTIGLGKADRIELLEIEWPTSGVRQKFSHVPLRKFIEVEELAEEYRVLDHHPIEFAAHEESEPSELSTK